MATAYGCRPSEFFHLETEIAAWALDEACLIEGRRVENALNEGKQPFSEQAGSDQLSVNSDQSSVISKQGYAPAPKRNMKRMKIPESGIW
jgi:hypothetical protein